MIEGIRELHKYGVIHRDIKTTNMVINIDSSSDKFINISYKDVIRLANLNGGYNDANKTSYNADGNNFKGYIKISDYNMTPAQLAELTKYFGENVFNIGSISSNLVIDQEQQYAQISVSGSADSMYTEGDNIYIYENKAIRLKCTKCGRGYG